MKPVMPSARTRTTLAAALALLAALSLAPAAPALAAGGSSDTTTAAPKRNADFDAAKSAIDRKDWPTAIGLLVKVVAAEPKNADAHNWLGYSYRKAGDYPKSFVAYKAALAVDPKHRGAHEYIGEAYLESGDLAMAEQHLKRLDEICSFGCDEHRQLKAAVAAYRKKHNIGS